MNIDKDTTCWANIFVTDKEGNHHKLGKFGIKLSGSRDVDRAIMRKWLGYEADLLAYEALPALKRKKAIKPSFDLDLGCTLNINSVEEQRKVEF